MKKSTYILFALFLLFTITYVIFASTEGKSGWFSSCTECKQGYYADEKGLLKCKPCESGKSSEKGSSSCAECADNKYSNNDTGHLGTTCESPNNVSIDNTSCDIKCHPGQYTDTDNDSSCSNCPKNTYTKPTEKDNKGGYTCTNCENGTFTRREGTTSSQFCLQCPPGWEGNGEGKGCKQCAIDHYKPNIGTNDCYKVPTNGVVVNLYGVPIEEVDEAEDDEDEYQDVNLDKYRLFFKCPEGFVYNSDEQECQSTTP